jgi:hypothetical protein
MICWMPILTLHDQTSFILYLCVALDPSAI